MPHHTQAPIFIHSLFRSGSTWIFEKFRASPAGYWCYQEPYHEALLQLNTNPESLLSYSEETALSLRHPSMTAPYFREFYDIKEKLTGKFDKCISYDSFFDPQTCPAIFPYTETLIAEAKGNPVLQCCRSFGRVTPLKEQFGGTHILLWRDPVNQWLSYQINDYFDATSLAIINAQNPPVIIQRLRQEIGFNEVHAENVQSEFAAFSEASLDAGQKYLIFYGLWLYHLLENQPLCEAEINLDMLSRSEEYVAGKTTGNYSVKIITKST
ncbi:hypothetical protein [Acidihalobacter aeolianus]|nr:hypothetical protein [Acidihalobacter aeolianus]